MDIRTVGKYTVVLEQVPYGGTPWLVRVHKKVLFFRKRVSSDWFLDELQARRFAEQLAKALEKDEGAENIKSRRPGWVLNRPAH